ncbi:MAG: polyribonucleotide nucleotidyltransferase, partial [Actinomycetota bacterium]|nr:polyribonucleotide nucleotidyltransferase [Actinomycetota bacterium]
GVRDLLDELGRRLGGSLVGGPDPDRAVVVDVDLDTGGGSDHVDVLALGADDLADLVDRHLDREDAWCVLGQIATRRADRLVHLSDDVEASFLRGLEGLAKNLCRDTRDLGVELQCSNDVLGACNLEVHVAECILISEDVVTALQLDTKISGVPAEVLREALEAAAKARLHIIGEMNKTISAPRSDLAEYAPRVLAIQVPVDKIGEVIGPKGKNINMITTTTGVEIDIDDDGTIRIGSTDQESAEAAARLIEETVNPRMPEVGERINGNVVKTTTFGAFINIAPNRDGLAHISKLSEERIDRVEDAVNVGDQIEVEVTDIDRQGRINLTPVAWLERQVAAGKTIEEARAAAAAGGGGGGGDRGPRRDDRGGGRERGGRDRDRGPRRDDRGGGGDRGGSRGGRERAPRRDDN